MTLIACTCDCFYQKDGYWTLECAVTSSLTFHPDGCVNFVPNQLQEDRKCFPDVPHRNEL